MGDGTGRELVSLQREHVREAEFADVKHHVHAERTAIAGGVDTRTTGVENEGMARTPHHRSVRAIGPDGFEPSQPDPKTGVLPLDDGPSANILAERCDGIQGMRSKRLRSEYHVNALNVGQAIGSGVRKCSICEDSK